MLSYVDVCSLFLFHKLWFKSLGFQKIIICYHLTHSSFSFSFFSSSFKAKIIDEAIQSKIHAAALELIENEKTKPCHMQIAVLLSVLPLSKSGIYRPIYATALRFLDDSESYAPLVLLESIIAKDDGIW